MPLVQSKWIEIAFYPITVILQVTPIVAIAPLILIYSPSTQVALLICAFLVAFFPILSNMVQGLKSVDHNLLNLFDLYGASRWQTLIYLKLPASLPYFMTGLRIGGGLALIAAVVAEFAAGSAGAGSGLAFRLLEAQFRLNIPRLFAALFLLSCLGVVIFAITVLHFLAGAASLAREQPGTRKLMLSPVTALPAAKRFVLANATLPEICVDGVGPAPAPTTAPTSSSPRARSRRS